MFWAVPTYDTCENVLANQQKFALWRFIYYPLADFPNSLFYPFSSPVPIFLQSFVPVPFSPLVRPPAMGYFVCGWPKSYLLPEHQTNKTSPPSTLSTSPFSPTAVQPNPNSVHSITPDPSDRYFLTVAPRGLYIWNARQHRILLACFLLSSKVVSTEGPFISAVWSPDSTTIVAALQNGLLLLFRVSPLHDISLLHFQSDSDTLVQPDPLPPLRIIRVAEVRIAHATATITALASCPAGALVATSAASLTCVAWDADMLWRAHIPELLRNNDAIAKMGVTAPSVLSTDPILCAIQQETGADDIGGIVALSYNRDLGFCGVVLGQGPALLLGLHSGGTTRPSAIDGRWLRTTDAVSIAMEPKRMLATVGLANGDVEQYYVGVPAGDTCPVMRSLSLSNWYFEPTDVGAASVLRWTEDGSALLVGWQKRGLAVWSVSGCRLMWTLPQVGGTLPSTPALRHRDSRSQQVMTPMEQGVSAAAWGPQGLFLWAAPRCTTESPLAIQDCHFMEFTFYKGSSGGTFSQSDSSRLAMFGSDRVLLLWHAEGADQSDFRTGTDSRDLFTWQHLLIPHDYLWRNWPPTQIVVNSDSTYIAAAGEHGVAICQVKSQRWRVFGDMEHDRRIRCCALAWVGKTIVIGNEVLTGASRYGVQKEYELLFYPRDQIEASALQAHRKLPSKPILTDVRVDGYLLVMCEDAQVFLYKITEHYNRSRIDLRKVYNLLLPTRESTPMYQQDKQTKMGSLNTVEGLPPPAPGGGISEAKIFPPLSHVPERGSETPTPTHIMLLRSTGSLILLDTERMVSTPLLRYVERFWYTPVNCTPFDMISHRPVWWAYGDDGLHVCFQDGIPRRKYGDSQSGDPLDYISSSFSSSSSRKKGVEVEQWFELDPEVYPLSIMSKYGMLLGATQGLDLHGVDIDGGSVPCHVIQVKRQPILHTLLRHLLMKPMSDERTALQVALKCVSQPQFVDSLEWLLYEAVLDHEDGFNRNADGKNEDNASTANRVHHQQQLNSPSTQIASSQGFPESPRRKKASGHLFPRVIRLLKYFGEYEDIVVRCARKLDSKRWPLLFSLAGEPAALLEQCFVSGRLRIAACLLVILQEMWGFISSTPHSLRLVEASLDRGELALAADLANFLTKADRAGMLNSSQLRTTEDVSWIGEAVRAPRGGTLSQVTLQRNLKEDYMERIPAVDLAVLNHARSLLNSMDLRNLVALSVRMDFPLAEWLRRELKGKNASKPFVRDFGTTILSLHRQFQYPEPDTQDVRRAMRKFNQEEGAAKSRSGSLGNDEDLSLCLGTLHLSKREELPVPDMTPRSFAVKANINLVGPGAETIFGSQLPPPPSSYDSEVLEGIRAKARELCSQELTYMMTVGRVARAPDLILVCATLLLDISVLRMVLRGHEELFEPYMAALHEFNVSGYNALVAVLNEIAAPK